MMVDYDVTESGIVVNTKTGKVLHQYKSEYGYLRVALCENGKQKRVFVHRLVAMKYIPNPHNLPQVNHKNGIKTDNRVENLEWCTASENQQHRRYVLKSGNRRVKRIETDTIYDSIKQAAEEIRRIFQISLGHVQTTQQPPGFIGHMCEKRLYWHID